MPRDELTRRSLLLIGCGIVCAHATSCGGADTGASALPASVAAGTASSLSVGTLRAVTGVPVAIARDPAGVYALSLICTQQACDMSHGVSSSAISCGCHGSVFDAQGNVLRGPATQPLEHFTVTEDAFGQLTIHTDQPVPAATRLGA